MSIMHVLDSRTARITSSLVFLSGLVLLFDIGGELHAALLYPANLSGMTWLHLGLEIAASVSLGIAFVLVRRDMRRSNLAKDCETEKLRTLRSEFDAFLQRRFVVWGLSTAEADIALLTLRGLRISEIAEIRNTREGTIKSQLSSIFRKSSVHNRTEFVAQFIDEFLDIAAEEKSGA